MKKNIAYFKGRDKTTLPNGKLCSKPTYDECFAMQGFCERLIYCLNDKAKERYKMHYEIDYLPDFLLLKNVDISYYQNSICTTKKSQAVLFSFDEKYIPRIVRYTDGSIRRKLPISEYLTIRESPLFSKKDFIGILFPSDILEKNALKPSNYINKLLFSLIN